MVVVSPTPGAPVILQRSGPQATTSNNENIRLRTIRSIPVQVLAQTHRLRGRHRSGLESGGNPTRPEGPSNRPRTAEPDPTTAIAQLRRLRCSNPMQSALRTGNLAVICSAARGRMRRREFIALIGGAARPGLFVHAHSRDAAARSACLPRIHAYSQPWTSNAILQRSAGLPAAITDCCDALATAQTRRYPRSRQSWRRRSQTNSRRRRPSGDCR